MSTCKYHLSTNDGLLTYKLLSNCVWLQIVISSCVNETALFPFLQSLLHKSDKMTDIH